MNAEQYARISSPFRGNTPQQALQYADKALTLLFYGLYPLLVVLLALGFELPFPVRPASLEFGSAPMHPLLIPCVIAPAAGFAVVSIMRKAVNAPRPYEALEIDPLIIKDTKGQSFPSKHVFSSFCIATCWLSYCIPAGVAFFVLAFCIALVRVIGGVHWPRDVIAGALLGLAFGAITFIW